MTAPGLSTIELGPLSIQVYGTMVGLGFLAAYFYCLRRAKRFGFPKNHLQNLTLLILFLAIIGARLAHFVLFPSEFFKNPAEFWRIDHGGLVFVGGFVLAILGAAIYCRLKKLSFWKFADVIAPAVALGYGIGRIGCLLTDLHPGIPTNLPWGVEYEGIVRHPTALYSSLAGFLIWLGLVRFEAAIEVKPQENAEVSPRLPAGKIALTFLVLFTIYRFGVEFLRAWDLEFDKRFFGLTMTQWVMPVVLIGLLLARKSKIVNRNSKIVMKIENRKKKKLISDF